MAGSSNATQIRLNRVSAAYWRLVIDNPPLNLMGPDLVLQFRDIMSLLETDEHVKVVVFESAVPGFFLNHSDFNGNLDELTNIPQGPTGLEAWPDILVRLPRAPVVSIALIRGRATGRAPIPIASVTRRAFTCGRAGFSRSSSFEVLDVVPDSPPARSGIKKVRRGEIPPEAV